MNNKNKQTPLKSSIYYNDRNHNIITLLLFVAIFVLSITSLLYLISNNLGWGFLFLIIFFLIFSILKIFRTSLLLMNLNLRYSSLEKSRFNIYIYENWHRKYVGNFWIFFLFCFIWFYSFILNLIFLYQGVTLMMNIRFIWSLYLLYFSIFGAYTIGFYLNKKLLEGFIDANKKFMEKNGITVNELKLTTKNTKNDYKNFVFLIISSFFLFIPLLLLLNKRVTIFYKNL